MIGRKDPAGDATDGVPPGLYSAELLETFAAGDHDRYLATGARGLRPRLGAAMALADLRPGLHLVDIGAGRGEASLHAARAGLRVTTIDFSPGSLWLARQTMDAGRLPSARAPGRAPGSAGASGTRATRPNLVRADATRLPLPDRGADRVLLLDLVEHLNPRQLAAALAEVRRILRPGGRVVIHTLPNRWALKVAYPVLRLVGGPGLPAEPRSAYERLVHVNEQDPRRLGQVLRAAGLEARVWVEEWSTRYAALGAEKEYPDALRAGGYPVLRRPVVRALARRLAASRLACVVGNDLFALAWLPGTPPPDETSRRGRLTRTPWCGTIGLGDGLVTADRRSTAGGPRARRAAAVSFRHRFR